MVKISINNKEVLVPENITIMEAAASIGTLVPHLCYLKDINEIGACRVCVVELEGKDKLVTACNNKVEEGMVIYTNSPKVRKVRRTNVELILSQHDCHCATCVRSGNCKLQDIANNLGILEIPYEKEVSNLPWDKSFPLIRDSAKCIKCMRCIQVCDKIQGMNVWDISYTGSRTTVDVSFNRKIKDSDCTLCGQCITHCPVGALRERDDTQKVFKALADQDKITVVEVAPAIRTAWGEMLGLTREEATIKRLVSTLRTIGFDYIFDTNFSADLTIMEEANEFLGLLTSRDKRNYPLFTSCCPGWIRFMKGQYPELVPYLSTAKSPQQMFGAVAKSYYANILGVDPGKIFTVFIMPCLAKKAECDLPTMNDTGAGQDVDLVLTTREVVRMIKAENIIPGLLDEEEFDSPLGISSGAGVIFGTTGGVMEAALRSAYYFVTGKNPKPDAFKMVRGQEGIREAELEINGITLRAAIVSGLANTRELIEKIKNGKAAYDFVEVMACPGGCVGGGGQPIHDGIEMAKDRADNLYHLDEMNQLRFSHENPSVSKLYEDYMEKPMSHKAHKLLHTDHTAWQMPQSMNNQRNLKW
jgi:NADP-reducing hydrogenase subunit HndD